MSDNDSPQLPADSGPLFARQAAELLNAGDVSGALTLARAGTARYPWYATGFLILGRCLGASGSATEAAAAFHDAQRLLPDAPALREALAALAGPPGAGRGAAPPGTAAEPAPDMEELARTLRGAKLEVPPLAVEPEQEEPAPGAGEGAHLVSATLAEIYVGQGQYAEAIRAYRVLIERQPDERQKYEKRIEEIEGMNRKAPRGG